MERVGHNITVADVKDLERQGMINRKLKRAPLKDTVTVPDGGYTIVRFHADNPGENSRRRARAYIHTYMSLKNE